MGILLPKCLNNILLIFTKFESSYNCKFQKLHIASKSAIILLTSSKTVYLSTLAAFLVIFLGDYSPYFVIDDRMLGKSTKLIKFQFFLPITIKLQPFLTLLNHIVHPSIFFNCFSFPGCEELIPISNSHRAQSGITPWIDYRGHKRMTIYTHSATT